MEYIIGAIILMVLFFGIWDRITVARAMKDFDKRWDNF